MIEQEAHLLRRLQAGEAAAFREFVGLHQQRIFALAYDLTGNLQDAEDLSQEAFINAFRNLGRFRGEARLSSWLYRIVLNLARNRRRKKALANMELWEHFDGDKRRAPHSSTVPEGNPELMAEASFIRRHLRRALAQLSPQQREIFLLRHDHDLPLQQISVILQLSEGTVKSQLFRALRKLRRTLACYRADLGLG